MILYRCDRCGSETTTPETFFDLEVLYTPRDAEGGQDLENEQREYLGQLCDACSDDIEFLALVQPPVTADVGAGEDEFTPEAVASLQADYDRWLAKRHAPHQALVAFVAEMRAEIYRIAQLDIYSVPSVTAAGWATTLEALVAAAEPVSVKPSPSIVSADTEERSTGNSPTDGGEP